MGRMSPAFILTLVLNVRHGGAYEDNIAMESFSPQRFETLVPHSYSGFLHRAGQLFSDADFGVKINNLKTEEEDREETPSGNKVDEMQEELTNLLFGDGDNITFALQDSHGDLEDAEEFTSDDYELYDEDKVAARRMSEEDPSDLPLAAELRQRRPYRGGGPGIFRRPGRPFRRRLTSSSQARPVVTRPLRDPMIHKIPGRIQKLPDERLSSSNSVRGEKSVDCDYYTESLCLGVRDYPRQEIARLLGANRRLSDDMIADVSLQSADDLIDGVSSNQEVSYDYSHYYGNRRVQDDTHNHRDFAQDGGFLCPSEIKYAKPKRGKTAQGVWKDIVNVDDYTQTLRMEKCLKPGGSCSYVSHHYKSQCSQVYNYHRLLSWDKERGLHMDIYKVPTCCSCHIMGYSYVYPPLKKPDQSPAIHHPPPPAPATSFSNSISRPVSRPVQTRPPPPPPPPPPQLTPDTFPRPQPDFDNSIPDFDPQEELQAFMNSIGDDFKDFNFQRDGPGPVRVARRPTRGPSRPVVGGFHPIAGELRPPGPPRNKRRPGGHGGHGHFNSIRRGDGFGPDGQPGGLENTNTRFDDSDDPLHKYQTIPVDLTDNFVKRKLDTNEEDNQKTEDGQKNINYAYHPIIDFFNQS